MTKLEEAIYEIYGERTNFIKENEYTTFVLIDKNKKFYNTYDAGQFYDIMIKLSRNDIDLWIDTITAHIEVWQALCGTRELRKVIRQND